MQMSPELRALAEQLLDHLRLEEEQLQAAHESLNELYAAFRAGDMVRARAALSEQSSSANQLHSLNETRAVVTVSLGDALGLPPDELTLSAIAAKLGGPLAEQLTDARERLRTISDEMKKITRKNASLVYCLRSYFRGVLAELTRTASPTARYGPLGSPLGTATEIGLKARG